MELLCAFFAVEDIEIEYHCYLWQDFIEELLRQNNSEMMEYYSGCLLNVLNSLVAKAKMTAPLMAALNSSPYTDKQFNDLAANRKRIRNLSYHLGQALGPAKPFTTVAERIKQAFEIMESDREKATLEIESSLFVVSNFLDNHNDLPPSASDLIEVMKMLPLEVVQLRRTVLDLITTLSPYASFIAKSEDVLSIL